MIYIRKICKKFNNQILFEDFSLDINCNDKILLSAPSGSGKTTLIKFLMGFEIIDSGEIIVDNIQLNSHNIKKIREKIAYVSQDADLELDTIENILDEIFKYKINKNIEDYNSNFKKLCDVFLLDKDIVYKNISSLSGGERQRVALIIALLLDRKILILDEITSGLDLNLKIIIRDYIINLNKTVIIISHDPIWDSENIREVILNAK